MQSEQVYLFRVEDYSSTSDLSYRDFELDVSEDVSESIQPGEQNDSLTGSNAVNTYKARGKARGEHYYFRYSYRDGARIRHCHIKGGNINNPIAVSRAEIVRAACREGRSCQQILELIKSWS